MRGLSYLPAFLFLLGLSLVAADVLLVVGAVEGPDREVTVAEHSDQDLTYLVTEVGWADPGDQLRTPGWIGYDNGPLYMCKVVGTGRPPDPQPDDYDPATDPNCTVSLPAFDGIRVAVVPGGCGERFAKGEAVPVYYDAPAGPPITVQVPDVSKSMCQPVPSAGENAIAVVWIMHQDAEDYPTRHSILSSVEGRQIANHGFVTIPGWVLQLDPFLRWGGATLLVAAIILGALPRPEQASPTVRGPAGASVELVEVGGRFLRSLRNTWLTVLFVVLALGVPLMAVLLVLAGQLASGFYNGSPREQPFIGWQTTLVWDMALAMGAAIVVAGRPTWAAQRTLQRWTRTENDAPVEGDL